MFWSSQPASPPELITLEAELEEEEESPVLSENDFIKMITLEEQYGYLKSLIKIQEFNLRVEEANEKAMMRVMMQLIDYYAQCISEAEANLDNIVKYFQHKMKDINTHYKKIVDAPLLKVSQPIQKELGNIEQLPQLSLKLPTDHTEEQDLTCIRENKVNLNKNLMVALQNQNIEAHIAESHRKADFLRKSIASSLKMQQDTLDRRREGKKKKDDKHSTPQATASGSPHKSRFKIKRKSESVFQSKYSSGSELDEAQSLYIETFSMELSGKEL